MASFVQQLGYSFKPLNRQVLPQSQVSSISWKDEALLVFVNRAIPTGKNKDVEQTKK